MPPREKTPEKSSAGIIKGMAPLSKSNKTVLRKKIIKVLEKTLTLMIRSWVGYMPKSI